jgi:hypothetical protein
MGVYGPASQDMHLIGIEFMSMRLVSIRLVSMRLIGMHLMSMHLMRESHSIFLYLYLILHWQHLVQPRQPLGDRLPGKIRSYPGDWPLNFRCGYPGRQILLKLDEILPVKG